jgi:D-serine deaminase-like pyridoxal phosphate-dependent protein
VTELQAGSYVFMDAFHGSLIPGFEEALTVLATVVSRQGQRVVLDTGLKTVGSDLMLPRLRGVEATTVSIAEEHLLLDVDPSSSLKVGDTAEVVPGYGPTTVNLHDVFFVVEEGSVVDIWPVFARGSGQGERRG